MALTCAGITLLTGKRTQSHKPYEIWRHEVLATLEHWLVEKWPKLAVRHDATTLELTSPQTGKAVVLEPQPPRFTSD